MQDSRLPRARLGTPALSLFNLFFYSVLQYCYFFCRAFLPMRSPHLNLHVLWNSQTSSVHVKTVKKWHWGLIDFKKKMWAYITKRKHLELKLDYSPLSPFLYFHCFIISHYRVFQCTLSYIIQYRQNLRMIIQPQCLQKAHNACNKPASFSSD